MILTLTIIASIFVYYLTGVKVIYRKIAPRKIEERVKTMNSYSFVYNKPEERLEEIQSEKKVAFVDSLLLGFVWPLYFLFSWFWGSLRDTPVCEAEKDVVRAVQDKQIKRLEAEVERLRNR